MDILEGQFPGIFRQLQPNPIATSGGIVASGLQVGLPPEVQAANHTGPQTVTMIVF